MNSGPNTFLSVDRPGFRNQQQSNQERGLIVSFFDCSLVNWVLDLQNALQRITTSCTNESREEALHDGLTAHPYLLLRVGCHAVHSFRYAAQQRIVVDVYPTRHGRIIRIVGAGPRLGTVLELEHWLHLGLSRFTSLVAVKQSVSQVLFFYVLCLYRFEDLVKGFDVQLQHLVRYYNTRKTMRFDNVCKVSTTQGPFFSNI